jgi:pyrimidine 5'-nucleotidase
MTKIHTILFDLDDTLYPNTNGLWEAIGERINLFMANRTNIPEHHVSRVRDEFLHSYGTTLNGLVANYQIDPHEYLDYVHDVPLENYIQSDPALQKMLSLIQQRKIIFTNSDSSHAARVLKILGVESHIEKILDIVALDFTNKPKPQAYVRAMEIANIDQPGSILFLDDRVDNLLPAAAIGMKTVLVGNRVKPDDVDYHLQHITELLDTVPGLVN